MKKGMFNLTTDIPIWFARMIVVIIVLVIIFSGIYVHVSRDINIQGYEAKMVAYNVLSCLSYGADRQNLGSIDRSKLKKAIFDDCIDSKDIALKMFLEGENGNKEEYFINPKLFEPQWPLCKAGNIRNFKYTCHTFKEYVLVEDKEPAIMEFNILLGEFTG